MNDGITSTRLIKEWFANQKFMRVVWNDKSSVAFTAVFPVARTIHPDEGTTYTLCDKIICTNVRRFDERLNPLDVTEEMIEELQKFLTENEWGTPEGLEEIWNWGEYDENEE